MVLTVLVGIAEFERSLIIERTRNGREAAKARGVQFGRRPTLTTGQVEHAREPLGAGRTAAETAELLGVHRATLYRALRGQETSQAEARRRGAFAEDALTEADAIVPASTASRSLQLAPSIAPVPFRHRPVRRAIAPP